MRFLALTLPTLPENLALDEALLLSAEAGGSEVLRLWQWPRPAVVLGAGGRIADDVDEAACRASGVPLARRSSGGGTVLLGPGCLLYSVVLAFGRDPALASILPSYHWILARVAAALARPGVALTVQGTGDLTLGDLKVSGSAQQRKRGHLLHHGTLLYDFDIATCGRFLRPPPRQPEYRRQREHSDFLTNIPFGADEIAQALRSTWNANAELADWPAEQVRSLVAEKFSRDEWVRRR